MPRKAWKLGNCAGHHFWPNGDLSVSRWVTTPDGKQRILTTRVGFRDRPGGGREKVVVDRYLSKPPACGTQ